MRGVTQRRGERIPGQLRGGHGAVDRERVSGRGVPCEELGEIGGGLVAWCCRECSV